MLNYIYGNYVKITTLGLWQYKSMSTQAEEAKISEEQHFYLVGQNWIKDVNSDLVPPIRDMTWIATVLELKVGGINRVLILLNQAVNARHGRPQKWLDSSTYPASWRRRKLPIASLVDFNYEIHQDSKERHRETTKVEIFRNRRLVAKRVEDDSNQVHTKELRRFTLHTAFHLEEDDKSNSVQFFIRANISTARKPVNALDDVLGGPVTSLLEFLGTPYWSQQSNLKSQKQVVDENLQPKEIQKVKKTRELVTKASSWINGRRIRLQSWLGGNPNRPMVVAVVATLSFYWVGIGIVWLRLINHSDPSIRVQYLTFIIVCFSPTVMLLLQRWTYMSSRDPVDQAKQMKRKDSGHYVQSVRFLRILIASIFGLVVYITVPAIAWPTVKSSNAWHWIWSDRQTLGLLATLMLGVLSTIFSNSVRELTLENSAIRNDVSERVKKLRTLTDEIHEASHRLWSEYEAHIKDFGKVFLFRANDFAHMAGQNDEGNPIDPVLKGLIATRDSIRAVYEKQINESTAKNAIDWLQKEHPEHDWDDESYKYFQAIDFDSVRTGTAAPKLSTLERIRYKEFQNINPIDADEQTDKPASTNLELTTGQKLAWIVRRFVASDDGRFAVLSKIKDDVPQRLMLQRRINALISTFKIDGSSDEKIFQTYGYFPTDESVTLSFIQAMRRSDTWLTSTSGQGMEEWLQFVYNHVQEFGVKNKKRFEQIEDLIRSFDELVSGMGIPASLFLDDLILFLDTMRTGTDDVLEKEGPLSDQQDRTLARILTYASVFYYAQVWCRDNARKLPLTFPSPFRALERPPLDRQPHETGMFEELRNALEYSLGRMMASGEVDQNLWPSVLELSNRQGPMTNFMRAARAFVTRRTFLDSKDFEMPTLEFMDVSEESGYLMTKYLFNDSNSSPRWRTLLDPMQPQDTAGGIAVSGPVRLKVARKSSISSFCKNFED